MKLNSTAFSVEVAKFGNGYLVKYTVTHIPACGNTTTTYCGQSGDLFTKDKHELKALFETIAGHAL